MEVTVTIAAKAGNGKAFKAGDVWYNVKENVMPFLAKLNKGDTVVVTYDKKGTSNIVTKVAKAEEREEVVAETTGVATCNVCGKALKDSKYKTCYMCNQKKSQEAPAATVKSEARPQQTWGKSDDDKERIVRTSGMYIAGYLLQGAALTEDVEAVMEKARFIAEQAITFIKNE
jgi:hypothetical protein